MSPTTASAGWGRGPLVAAGATVLWVLAALVALAIGAVTDELISGAVVASLLLLAALASLVVLAVLLVRDRFPREVLRRLDEIEVRLATTPAPARHAAASSATPPTPASAPGPVPAAGRTANGPEVQPPTTGQVVAPATAEAAPPPPAVEEPAPAPAPAISWELLLGGRGLAVVGGVVLLIAVGLFLKFGWDQGWFRPSPAGRVALGLGAGVALLVVGELARRRDRYVLLSQALTAAGLGAVYLSVWAAHGLYHLVSAVVALVILAAAALAGVAVATTTHGRFVAALSTVGGLLAPVVVDLPPEPPTALYVYLLVLLGAAAAVGILRGWPELGPIAVAGIAIHVAGAYQWQWPDEVGRLVDAGFLLAATALLIAISLGFAWRRARPPGVTELATLAAASLGGWGAGLARLEPLGEVVGGSWTVAVLLVELAAAHVMLRRLGAHTPARRVFLALAGLLLVALPPVLWDGAWVAFAWALEALAAAAFAPAGMVGWAGSAVTVMAAWACLEAVDARLPTSPFGNLEWLLRGLAAAALVAILILVERRRAAGAGAATGLRIAAAPAAAVAVLAWLVPEIDAWAQASAWRRGVPPVLDGLVVATIAVVLLAGWRRRTETATWITGLLAATAALLWPDELHRLERWRGAAGALPLATVALTVLATAARGGLESLRTRRTVAGLAIAVAAVAVVARLRIAWPGPDLVAGGIAPAALGGVAACALLAATRRLPPTAMRTATEIAGWLVALAAGSRLLASALALAPAVVDAESRRAGLVALSVLWGGAGLALVLAGLAGGAPHRRHLGLALLAATVLKVFLSDLASAPTVLRIVAFLVTGLALLAGAWLYARYREHLEPT